MTDENQVATQTLAELKRELRVVEVLNNANISPAKNILDLINAGELSPKDEIKAWEIILKYCEPQVASQQVQVVNGNIRIAKEMKTKETAEIIKEATLFDDAEDYDG